MIIVKGSISAQRACPQCGKELIKHELDKPLACQCGWIWAVTEVGNMSSGILGTSKIG